MKIKKQTLIVLLFLSVNCTHAQIMNIEQYRMENDTAGWAGNASLSLQYLKNTTELVNAGVSVHLQYKAKKCLFLWKTSYILVKAKGENLANDCAQHLRYNYFMNEWLIPELFTQFQFNDALNVNFRWLAGAGPRFRVLHTKPLNLFAAAAYMYEYEELINPIVQHNDHRLSCYISFSLKFLNNMNFFSTTYFQPKINEFSDYRLSSQADLKIKISRHFGFTLSYIYFYDTVPAESTPHDTHTMQNTLSFEL